MTHAEAESGEQSSVEVLRDRTRAWWTSVLAGQVDQAHPVQGTKVSAKLDGDTLVISGSVPSQEDSDEIEREVEHLRGSGFQSVRNDLSVEPDSEEESGLLVQTLVAMFENEEQAGFAEGYLEGHAHVRPAAMTVVAPDGRGSGHEAVHAVLPETYWEDAEKGLDAGRSLLIVTVDETEAFKARELLDEETRSLETIALPPEPAANVPQLLSRLQTVPKDTRSSEADHRADETRQQALQQEAASP